MTSFRWKIEINAVEYDVLTTQAGDLSLNVKKEKGKWYYRETLSGGLKFVRGDFDRINDAAFSTQFFAILEKQETFAGAWVERWRGEFYKTDCEFDNDEQKITVQPRPLDKYTDFLGSFNKEINIIDLAPERTPINLVVPGLIQFYIKGNNFLTNITSGVSWEQPVDDNSITSADLQNVHKFFSYADAALTNTFFFPGQGEIVPDISGQYAYSTVSGEYSDGGNYRLAYDVGAGRYNVWNDAKTTLYYQSPIVLATVDPWDLVYTAIGSGDTTTFRRLEIYARMLTNETTINGDATFNIPTTDIVPSNPNYSKIWTMDEGITLYLSDNNSTDATKFGTFPSGSDFFSGNYFDNFDGINFPFAATLPINRSEWLHFSVWFRYNALMETIQEEGGTVRTIEHAYKLVDVIDTMLKSFDSTLSHEETDVFSNFLYGSSNTYRGTRRYPFIIPKTNVTVGEYDQPATNADLRFQDIIELLENLYNCGWFLDSDGKFKVEFVEYFRNGGDDTTETIGKDLTTLLEPKTGKSLSFASNKYSYDLSDIPERIEFYWQDEVTRPFKGENIVITSPFTQKGNVVQKRISRFTSDIDYIYSAPSEIIKQGFVYIDAELDTGIYSAPFVEVDLATSEENYKLQNGAASMYYAHKNYFSYNLPAEDAKLNTIDITADSVIRSKVQEIPFVGSEFDYSQLIQTDLGVGEIQETEIELEGGKVKKTIIKLSI